MLTENPLDAVLRCHWVTQPGMYWRIYRGPGFLAVVWSGSSPHPLPLLPSSFSVLLRVVGWAYWKERGKEGVGESNTTARKPGPLEIIQYSLDQPDIFRTSILYLLDAGNRDSFLTHCSRIVKYLMHIYIMHKSTLRCCRMNIAQHWQYIIDAAVYILQIMCLVLKSCVTLALITAPFKLFIAKQSIPCWWIHSLHNILIQVVLFTVCSGGHCTHKY
jgi:hypothetical protein